jgi:hypothetical protein
MAFNVSALGDYTRQSLEPLLTSAIFGATTQDLIRKNGILLTGVKSAESIPILETDANFQTDSCSFDASGATTFTQRTVTVGKIKVEEKLCPKDLETKFTQEALNAGSTYEDFGNAAFEAAYLDRKNERIAAQLETAIWQGDTDNGNMNLNKFNGLQKLIAAGSPVSANTGDYTSTTTAITSSNVLAIMKQVKNKIPAALKGNKDMIIWCGYDVYELYVDAGVAANYFHYSFNDQSKYDGLVVPGTSIRLQPVHGLDSTGDIYAIRTSNMCLAVDVVNEESSYKLWYSQDNNDVRFRAAWKTGVNVAFTTECVQFLGSIS